MHDSALARHVPNLNLGNRVNQHISVISFDALDAAEAAWSLLDPADVLMDTMRGRSSTWTRIRLNLRNVPAAERPPQEALEVDYDPWTRGG
jgi:hypothetical protein